MKRLKILACILCMSPVLLLCAARGEAAVTLGQSCALSGPTAFLGVEMQKGAKSYFDKHAPSIILKTKDDGYEPGRCRGNTETFIKQGVDALFGYVGTPTSKVAVPIATLHKKIFFGAFTGASFLSDTKTNPHSFSVRDSYNAEIENMVRRLKEDLGISKIGLFVQRDAFGLAGIRGAVRAVQVVDGVHIIPAVPEIPAAAAPKNDWRKFWRSVPNYRRNTVSVGQGVRQVKGVGAEAVILVGAYRPCAAAINRWRELGFQGPVINISFVGSLGLAKRLKKTDNVFVSQVVPNPWDSSIPVVSEYQQDLDDGEYGFVSLEGYIAAKILHKAISAVSGKVTSDSIKKSLESMSGYDVGGVNISFGSDDHRGMDSVYLTAINKADKKIHFTYVSSLSGVK